ncbi:MAG: hypothetical protein QOJ32_539 [Frankiaceae bacterium]|nr:hypothetical protein [Frankiaceae bacterium]
MTVPLPANPPPPRSVSTRINSIRSADVHAGTVSYACTNCGHWQRWFPSGPPPTCPVCVDVRNALPVGGFEFRSAKEVADRLTSSWSAAADGVTQFSCSPDFGLAGSGWVIETDDGLVGFEAAPFYDEAALAELRSRGGVVSLGSSHVHGYGALWQLQDELAPPVVFVGVDDLIWTKAFVVTWPTDEVFRVAPGLTLHRTGGHFAGHSVLHDERRGYLFCGDSLKVDLGPAGEAVGLSAHKAFHAQIPLSHGEIRFYRSVVERLDFSRVFTPFETAEVGTAEVLALLDHLLAGPPFAGPVPLADLRATHSDTSVNVPGGPSA